MATRTVRRVTDRKAQDAEAYRYWAARTTAERMQAVFELTREGYASKGIDLHMERLERSTARFQRLRG